MDWRIYFDAFHNDIDGHGWNVADNKNGPGDSGIVARFPTAKQALDWLQTQLSTNEGGE